MPGESLPQQAPMVVLYGALLAAKDNVMPPFSVDSFLQSMHLEGDMPDERTLGERLYGEQPMDVPMLRATLFLKRQIKGLIRSTNECQANPAQEEIARCLGMAVTRQLTREKHVCPDARSMALDSTRSDLIPYEVKQQLQRAS